MCGFWFVVDVYLHIFNCVSFWLHGCCGEWEGGPVNQVNHTSWVAVVTPTDRPKSSCCLIELFCSVVCVITLPFWHFCWCRGFCHRTGSDLLLFVLSLKRCGNDWGFKNKSLFGQVSTINGTAILLYSRSRWSRSIFTTQRVKILDFEFIQIEYITLHLWYDWMWRKLNKYKKRLLLRCIPDFKSDLFYNMRHMLISGTELSSVILCRTFSINS